MNITELITVSTILFIFTTILTFLISRSKISNLFLDAPDSRKLHTLQIPRIGGFAILVSYFIALLILRIIYPQFIEVLFSSDLSKALHYSAFILFILGFFDDTTIVELTVPIKFAGQFLAAIGVVFFFNINFENISIFNTTIHLGLFGKFVALFWIVGVTNSFNIIDGIDGLSGSVTLISLLTALAIAFLTGHSEVIISILPFIAIISAFLIHNYPPASIFAGDTGSLLFGSIASIMSVYIGAVNTVNLETLSVFFLVGFPVIEVWISMARRFYHSMKADKGVYNSFKSMFKPDNLHMHHRLIFKGYTHSQALHFLLFLAVSISSIAIILTITDSVIIKIISILYSTLAVVLVLRKLEYGKNNFVASDNGEAIKKVIAITGSNEFFENSLRHYTQQSYWVFRFERASDIIGRRVHAYIIYNENNTIATDIEKVNDIRSINSTEPIFFISDVSYEEFEKYNNFNAVFLVNKPVDMPYLLHDLEQITPGTIYDDSNLNGTIAIQGAKS